MWLWELASTVFTYSPTLTGNPEMFFIVAVFLPFGGLKIVRYKYTYVFILLFFREATYFVLVFVTNLIISPIPFSYLQHLLLLVSVQNLLLSNTPITHVSQRYIHLHCVKNINEIFSEILLDCDINLFLWEVTF